MTEQQQTQAEVNARIAPKIPTSAGWSSTVAIAVAKPPSVHLLGTASLFEVAGERFVVTAAHVIRLAHEYGKTIGITSAGRGFIATAGEWFASSPRSEGTDEPLDVAVYPLPRGSVERLKDKRFLRREDVDFREQSATAVFALFGFPGLWSAASEADDTPLRLKALEYVAHAVSSEGKDLIGFNPRYHLLLDVNPEESTTPDGAKVTVHDRSGRPATLLRRFVGISGCAVWAIGDLTIPIEDWGPPRVVGIETGVYQPSEVIRVTRWVAATTLINEVAPHVRPAIDLWTPA
jgi:hypothetical protein